MRLRKLTPLSRRRWSTMSLPRVDPELCVGCGLCAEICPELFELGEDGKARVTEGADPKRFGCLNEAAESCPVGAISTG